MPFEAVNSVAEEQEEEQYEYAEEAEEEYDYHLWQRSMRKSKMK